MCEQTRITIMKKDGEVWFEKKMSASVCHYCKNPELIVIDIDDYRIPRAVKCGSCGMAGPWCKTEEEAVKKWNAISNFKTENSSEWRKLIDHDPQRFETLPGICPF